VDDLEFRKNATIDPGDQRPEFLGKIKQSLFNRRFVEEQLAFEQQLENTLDVSPPENLTDRLILSQQLSQHKLQRKQQHQTWLFSTIAASLVLAVSLFFLLPETINSSQLAQQIITHVHNDTHALNVNMDVPKNKIDTMLASYGGKLDGPIGKVSFLGLCIIGEQTGVHMVLNTGQNLVTVIILPTQRIDNSHPLNDTEFSGLVYPSQKGSIAIISEHAESIEQTRRQIDRNLNWLI